ncbi:MAG TPA: hypothetical protein P5164_03530 [Thermoanaerobaculia bacterium]|nr:hypothetical protein [Thermoanaerobaculia bacterium]
MRPLAGFLTSLAVLLAAAPAASAAGAENLVANGAFRDGISSWSRLDLVSYSAMGAATPGSARITLPSRPEGGDAMLQCVAVEGWRLYDLGAAVRLPEWPEHSGGVSVRLSWHALPNCQGPSLRGAPSLDFSYTEPAGWQVKEKRRIPAPQEAVSALVVVVARSAGDEPYPIFVDDVVLRRSVEEEDVFLPTAASVRGAKGERFETDLWVHNPAPAERMFTLRLWRDGRPTTPVVLRVGAKQTRHLPDVLLSGLGQRDVAGAVQLSYDPGGGPMHFSARVVTVNPESPGNGTLLPVLRGDEARTDALFHGLSGARNDVAGAHRVNAGVFNPHDAPVEAIFWLYDGDGTDLGTFSRTLPPGGWLQVNDVFREVGAAGVATEGARLAFHAALPVFPFVIAVDNRSGDGTSIAARDVPVLP